MSSSDADDLAPSLLEARTGSVDALDRLFSDCRTLLRPRIETLFAGRGWTPRGIDSILEMGILRARNAFTSFVGNCPTAFLDWVTARMLEGIGSDDSRATLAGSDQPPDDREFRLEEIFPVGPPSEHTRTLVDSSQALREALLRLPEETRILLEWRHRDRLSWLEIGERLQMEPTQARETWFLALRRLERELKPPHGPPT